MVIVVLLGTCGMVGCFAVFLAKARAQKLENSAAEGGSAPAVQMMRRRRREYAMPSAGVACNDRGLSKIQLNGTYSESGETKPCFYSFDISAQGTFTGFGRDDDGAANVEGLISLSQDTVGQVWWGETRSGCELEAEGKVYVTGGGSDMRIEIQANYASAEVGGCMRLTSTVVQGGGAAGALAGPGVVQGIAVQSQSNQNPSSKTSVVVGTVVGNAVPSNNMVQEQPVTDEENENQPLKGRASSNKKVAASNPIQVGKSQASSRE